MAQAGEAFGRPGQVLIKRRNSRGSRRKSILMTNSASTPSGSRLLGDIGRPDHLVPDHGWSPQARRPRPHPLIHIVAVDRRTIRTAGLLPEKQVDFLDLRLGNGPRSYQALHRQKEMTAFAASKFPHAGRLRHPLPRPTPASDASIVSPPSRKSRLIELAFVLGWPKIKPDQRREAVLPVRLPRAQLLPLQEGPRVLRESHPAVPEEQEGQDLPRSLPARR